MKSRLVGFIAVIRLLEALSFVIQQYDSEAENKPAAEPDLAKTRYLQKSRAISSRPLRPPAQGNKIKFVARAAAASSRIPAAIRHIAVLAWQPNSDFGVEPITADAGLGLHLTEPGKDKRTMLGLLPKDAGVGGIAFLLQGLGLLCVGRTRLIAGCRNNTFRKDY
jgi:hypothetical protein